MRISSRAIRRASLSARARGPILQVGADLSCDGQRIARVLERLHPEPSLFPAPAAGGAGSEGLCFATSLWADRLRALLARRLPITGI